MHLCGLCFSIISGNHHTKSSGISSCWSLPEAHHVEGILATCWEGMAVLFHSSHVEYVVVPVETHLLFAPASHGVIQLMQLNL
jgi:hypothetical protein